MISVEREREAVLGGTPGPAQSTNPPNASLPQSRFGFVEYVIVLSSLLLLVSDGDQPSQPLGSETECIVLPPSMATLSRPRQDKMSQMPTPTRFGWRHALLGIAGIIAKLRAERMSVWVLGVRIGSMI